MNTYKLLFIIAMSVQLFAGDTTKEEKTSFDELRKGSRIVLKGAAVLLKNTPGLISDFWVLQSGVSDRFKKNNELTVSDEEETHGVKIVESIIEAVSNNHNALKGFIQIALDEEIVTEDEMNTERMKLGAILQVVTLHEMCQQDSHHAQCKEIELFKETIIAQTIENAKTDFTWLRSKSDLAIDMMAKFDVYTRYPKSFYQEAEQAQLMYQYKHDTTLSNSEKNNILNQLAAYEISQGTDEGKKINNQLRSELSDAKLYFGELEIPAIVLRIKEVERQERHETMKKYREEQVEKEIQEKKEQEEREHRIREKMKK